LSFNPSDYKTTGERLRALRERNGWIVEQLLNEIKRRSGKRPAKSTVSGWENDTITPRVGTYETLANIYGVSIDWLRTGRGKASRWEEQTEGMENGLRKSVARKLDESGDPPQGEIDSIVQSVREQWDSQNEMLISLRESLVASFGEEWVSQFERNKGIKLPVRRVPR
jgi:transcriptional regulator with XRE-family HTH domain